MSTKQDDGGQKTLAPTRRVWLSVFGGLLVFIALPVLLIAIGGSIERRTDSEPVAERISGQTEAKRDHDTEREPEHEAVPSGNASQVDVVPRQPTRESVAFQQDAMRRARVEQMQTQARLVRERMVNLEEKRSEFVEEVEKVLANEQGQRLAADVELVDRFTALREKERPSEEEITSFRNELDILLEPLESIEPSADVSPNWVAHVDGLTARIRDAIRLYDNDLRSLRGLIARGGSLSPSPTTLEVAVVERQNSLLKERLERIQKTAKEAEEAEAKRKLEYERLRREALSPQVLSVLAPLTTPDYSQPRQITGGMATGEKTADKKPVSLSRLRSLGVLERDERGMIRVALLNSWEWTRRPRWNIKYQAPEPNQWSPQLESMIRATQQYLIKYGDVLVAEGLLSP